MGLRCAQGLPTEKDKLMATSTYPSSIANNSLNMTNQGQATSALPGYYNNFLRQNSLTSDVNRMKQESSSNVSNHGAPFKPYKGPKTSSPGLIQNSPIDGLSSSHSLEGSQNIQDHTIRKILQEMVNNSRKVGGNAAERVNREINKSTVVDLPTRGRVIDIVQNGFSSGNSTATVTAPGNALGSSVGRISSSGPIFNRESPEFSGNNSFIKKRDPEVTEKHLLPEALLNMNPGYHGNGKFSSSSGTMCYGWKA